MNATQLFLCFFQKIRPNLQNLLIWIGLQVNDLSILIYCIGINGMIILVYHLKRR